MQNRLTRDQEVDGRLAIIPGFEMGKPYNYKRRSCISSLKQLKHSPSSC